MPRNPMTGLVLAATATALSTTVAHARPIFMEYEGIKGECSSNSNQVEVMVGGRRVVHWLTPAGTGELVFRPSARNQSRPMESLSLNISKVGAETGGAGAHVGVADDVWVEGRIVTAAVWARWTRTAGGGIRIDFGRAAQAAGILHVTLKRGTIPVHTFTCAGSDLECDPWFLSVTCPEIECSVLCPSLCGVPSTSRPDPIGGVAIDLPLPGPTAFAVPGGPVVTAEEISVGLSPDCADSPMTLAGTRLSVGGLPGLQINSARGEFDCPADFNGSGSLSVQDIFDFLAAYFGGSPDADFNGSGAISGQDLFDFLAAYFAGCV